MLRSGQALEALHGSYEVDSVLAGERGMPGVDQRRLALAHLRLHHLLPMRAHRRLRTHAGSLTLETSAPPLFYTDRPTLSAPTSDNSGLIKKQGIKRSRLGLQTENTCGCGGECSCSFPGLLLSNHPSALTKASGQALSLSCNLDYGPNPPGSNGSRTCKSLLFPVDI